MVSDRTRCVVADDHPGILEAISNVLTGHGFDVVEKATNGEAAVAAINEFEPDVAMMDLRMPRLSGIEIARQLRLQRCRTRVVLYTAHGDAALVSEAVDAGVNGYILKEAPLSDIVRALSTVADGGTYIDPVLAGSVAVSSLRRTPVSLSLREREVLRLLAEGHSNDAIAKELSIAPDTVRTHITNAMSKLDAVTRTQAVAAALRQSLIA